MRSAGSTDVLQRLFRPGRHDSAAVAQDLWALLAFTLICVGTGLGLRDPWPADEPRFALIARDMVRSADWLIPMVGGDIYADKPPLYFWLMALLLKFTGSLRLAFLLPSLLATLGTVTLVYDLARRLWNRETGLAAALLLLLTVQFVWQGRQAQIDATLCFWTTLGLYGLLRHLLLGPAWRWYLVGWAAAGLGVITKGVGFLPLLVLLPYALARGEAWRWRSDRGSAWRWWLGPLAFLAAVGVWLVPMLLASLSRPELAAYRDEILFQQTVERYSNAWHHHEPVWYFIVNVIPALWLPLTALLPWLVPKWREALAKHDLRILLLLSWVALVVLFFSASSGKRGVYVLPAVPALALAAAPWLLELLGRAGPRRVFVALAWLLVSITLLAGTYLLFDSATRTDLMQTYGLPMPAAPLLTMGVIGAAVCAGFRVRQGFMAYAVTLAVIMMIVGLWINPGIDAARSGERFVEQVEQQSQDIGELGLVGYKEQYLLKFSRPTVNFGHRRWQDWEREAADAAAWLNARPGRAVLVEGRVRDLCFPAAQAKPVGVANNVDWFLVTGSADPACTARGQPTVAKAYDPPA